MTDLTLIDGGAEGARLAEDEAIIERGVAAFVDVGRALADIRDRRLFVVAGFEDFPSYCKARWGFGERHATRQIAAADVAQLVEREGLPVPPTESAGRVLVNLYNDQAYGRMVPGRGWEVRDPGRGERAVVAAWREVVARHATNVVEGPRPRPITAADVRRVTTPPASYGEPGWRERAGMVGDDLILARKHLEHLERAVDRPIGRVHEDFRENLRRYAATARELADRLEAVAGWRDGPAPWADELGVSS